MSILRDLAHTSCLVADESIDGKVRSLLETVKDYARQKVARGAVGITALRDRFSVRWRVG